MSKQKGKQKHAQLYSQRLGKNIKQARQDLGLSQSELGGPIGLNQQQVSYIEAGHNCKVNIYPQLAEEMNMSMEELASYGDKKKKEK